MARSTFGGTTDDSVEAIRTVAGQRVSSPQADIAVTFWSAKTGGAQYTDLLDSNGAPTAAVVSDDNGQLPEFSGPDGVQSMWADAGAGRVRINPNTPGASDPGVAGFVNDGASATALALKSAYVPQSHAMLDVLGPGRATGDGSTDDTTAIHAARDAAATFGAGLRFPKGTYITTGLTLNASMRVEFAPGAVVKKKSTATAPAVTVTGSGVAVEVTGGELDGNRTAGATDANVVVSAGATAIIRNSNLHHAKTYGVKVTGSGSAAYCFGVQCNDNDGGFGTAGAGDGFYAELGGLLVADDECSAARNVRSGFYLNTGAADGCRVGGYATRNGLAGFQIRSDLGHLGRSICVDNDSYGVMIGKSTGSVTGWTTGTIETRHQGLTAANGAATGVELLGVDKCHFGPIYSEGSFGYTLAVARGTDLTPSTYNSFADIYSKDAGDPVVSISGSSAHNRFGDIYAYSASSVAVYIGEAGTTGNDYNTFGDLIAEQCEYGALRITGGAYNTFNSVISRDTFTTDSSHPGAIDFEGTTTHDNIVRWFEETASGTKPTYGVYADTNAVGNYVLGGSVADVGTGAVNDVSGKNVFSINRTEINSTQIKNGGPNSTIRESFDRLYPTLDLNALTSGVVTTAGIPLRRGDVISHLVFLAGTVGLTMGTAADGHLWFGLYDPSGVLVAQTADQGGSVTWGAGAKKDLALTSPYTADRPGVYYAAVLVVLGTGGSPVVNKLRGLNPSSPLGGGPVSGQRNMGGTSGSGLTALPSTITIAAATVPYVVAY